MATTDVCNDFHAKHDETVHFTNASGVDCELKQGTTDWPFTDSAPFKVPIGGSKTKVKADLPNGKYDYIPSCCTVLVQKSVTVPLRKSSRLGRAMETVPPSRAVFKGDFIQPGQI